MKFNKLYNLIEGVFEPASPKDAIQRKKDMINHEDGFEILIKDIIDENPEQYIGDIRVEPNIKNKDWSVYIELPTDPPFDDMTTIDDLEGFIDYIEDAIKQFDLYIYDKCIEEHTLYLGVATKDEV